jgi:hypothetical protein
MYIEIPDESRDGSGIGLACLHRIIGGEPNNESLANEIPPCMEFDGESISQIACVGDTSDEITGMPVGCKYILRPVDICNFGLARFLHASLSVSLLSWESI